MRNKLYTFIPGFNPLSASFRHVSLAVLGLLLFPAFLTAQNGNAFKLETFAECEGFAGRGVYTASFGYNNPTNSTIDLTSWTSVVEFFVLNETTGEYELDPSRTFVGQKVFPVGTAEADFNPVEFFEGEKVVWSIRLESNNNDKAIIAEIDYTQCTLLVPPIDPGWPAVSKTDGVLRPELASLATNYALDAVATLAFADASPVYDIKDDSVRITAVTLSPRGTASYADALSFLESLGFNLTNDYEPLKITGWLSIDRLFDVDPRTDLYNYARAAETPIGLNELTGNQVRTQGDTAQGTFYVRGGYSVFGEDVKVGVISDSYDFKGEAAGDIAAGELPGPGNPDGYTNPIDIVVDNPNGGTDEGRAMLQIIHDIAPEADLAFHTGFLGAGPMAQAIRTLQADGCDVIVDDVTYTTEPWFTDGIIARTVDSVAAEGVTYITSAGNFGERTHEAVFQGIAPPPASGLTGEAHDFSGTGDALLEISVSQGFHYLAIQWEDTYFSTGQTENPGTAIDLDIYLTDENGVPLFGLNHDNTAGDPYEILPFTVNVPSTTANIMVVNASGPVAQPFRFKIIAFRVVPGFAFNEHQTNSLNNSTVTGHANAAGAFTVGAVLYSNTPSYGEPNPTAASFSSRGGLLAEGGQDRMKPNIMAPNGVNTTVDLGGIDLEGDGPSNFFGTSASAPHVAGAAALLQSAWLKFQEENLSAEDTKTLFTSNALDMNVPGYDVVSGSGLLQADQVLLSFANPNPVLALNPLVYDEENVTPGEEEFVLTVKGNYFNEQTTVYLRDQPLETTFVDGQTLTAIVPAYEGNPAIFAESISLTNSGLDGITQDTAYFSDPILTPITISADFQTRPYGTINPEFTYTVTGLPEGVVFEDLGFPEIVMTTTAELESPVRSAAYPILIEFASEPSVGLGELYDWTLESGELVVTNLPVTITPEPLTITYGESISGQDVSYIYDMNGEIIQNLGGAFVNIGGAFVNLGGAFVNTFLGNYESSISETVAMANLGGAFVNLGGAFVNSNFLATQSAIDNGRLLEDGTRVVDVNAEDLDFVANQVFGNFLGGAYVNAEPSVDGRGGTGITQMSNFGGAYVNFGGAFVNDVPFTDPDLEVFANLGGAFVNLGGAFVNLGGAFVNLGGAFVNLGGAFVNLGGAYVNEVEDENGDTQAVAGIKGGFLIYSPEDISSITLRPIVLFNVDGEQTYIDKPDVGTYTIYPPTLIDDVATNTVIEYGQSTLTVEQAPLTITTLVDAASITFGDAVPNITFDAPGLVNGDVLADLVNGEVTYVLDKPYPESGVGTYTATFDLSNLATPQNYDITLVEVTFEVLPAPLTITADVQDADNQITFGDAFPEVLAIIDGYQAGDSEATFASLISFTPTDYTDVGTYVVSPEVNLSNPAFGNYTVTLVSDELEVLQAPLSVATILSASTITYGDAFPTVTPDFTGLVRGDEILSAQERETTIATVTFSPASYTDAGTYTITPSVTLLSDNYILGTVTTAELSVLPATLTVVADDLTIRFGDVPNYTATVSGFTRGDTYSSVFGGTEVAFTITPEYTNVGTYALTPSLPAPTNYVLSFVDGIFNVLDPTNGTKQVNPTLDCVQPDPDGLGYIAIFVWENRNRFDVFVPEGELNQIVPDNPGTLFDDSNIPTLFAANSVGTWEMPFDGQDLKWILSSKPGGGQGTAQVKDAPAGSKNCSTVFQALPENQPMDAADGLETAPVTSDDKARSTDTESRYGLSTAPSFGSAEAPITVQAWPNPTQGQLQLRFTDERVRPENVQVFDILGKMHTFRVLDHQPGQSMELDLSRLPKGQYIVRVRFGDQAHALKVIKW